MSKFQKITLGVFVALLAVLVFLESSQPTPINWYPTYNKNDKIPYGAKVLHTLLKDHFKQQLIDVDQPPYLELVTKDSTMQGTYFFVNDRLDFDEAELSVLLDWVSRGNNLFLAATDLSPALYDTLKFDTRIAFHPNYLTTKPLLRLTDPNRSPTQTYFYDQQVHMVYFNRLDTLNTTVLGETQIYENQLEIVQPLANFIKVQQGQGAVYIHTMDDVFSNYFLLHPHQYSSYTEHVLSYINDGRPVYWDNYYKSGKAQSYSPLRVILYNKHLKWSYYTLLIGCVLFVFFEGKRKQRAIPIKKPPTNKTYEYTQTIAGLYLENRNNLAIAQKQIALFLEYIRTRLRVPTDQIDNRFFKNLASVSSISVEKLKQLFNTFQQLQNQAQVTDQELIELHKNIQEFKSQIDGKSRNSVS